MPFVCSICEEESAAICVRCTKDTCSNHLCERCGCCSDCCACEVPLDEHEPAHAAPLPVEEAKVEPPAPEVPQPDPEPEPPHPPPDPDPFPGDEPEPGPVAS